MENRNKTPFEQSVEELSKEQLLAEKQGYEPEKKKPGGFAVKTALVLVCAAVFVTAGIILLTQLKDQSSTNEQKDDAAKIYNEMVKQMSLYAEGDNTENAASLFDASGSYIPAGETASERTAASEQDTPTESVSAQTDVTDTGSESAYTETSVPTETEEESVSSAETQSETETESITETESTTATAESTEPVINEYQMPDTPAGTWLSSMPIPSAAMVRDSTSTLFVRNAKGALIALQQRYKNSDIVAYLSIGKVGSTGRIETSVTEGAVTIYADNDLYIDHDLYKLPNANGALFIDSRCDVNPLNNHNTIIYGHHLSTGSTKAIFGHLDYFRNGEYMTENPDVMLQMGDAVYYYTVVLCATLDFDETMIKQYAYTPELVYGTRYANTEAFFSAYRKITADFARLGVPKIIRYTGWPSALDPDGTGNDIRSKLSEGDRFLTLSTCYGELGTSARCIVICKLTKVLLSANQ